MFAGEDGRSAGSAQTIRTACGLLFLFPSFLLHAVRPYTGNSLRISIAFNLGLYPEPMKVRNDGKRVVSCG